MIPKRKLGEDGPEIGAIGYGAMVLEGHDGKSDDKNAADARRHVVDIARLDENADSTNAAISE